jgi:hypothetical protein
MRSSECLRWRLAFPGEPSRCACSGGRSFFARLQLHGPRLCGDSNKRPWWTRLQWPESNRPRSLFRRKEPSRTLRSKSRAGAVKNSHRWSSTARPSTRTADASSGQLPRGLVLGCRRVCASCRAGTRLRVGLGLARSGRGLQLERAAVCNHACARLCLDRLGPSSGRLQLR